MEHIWIPAGLYGAQAVLRGLVYHVHQAGYLAVLGPAEELMALTGDHHQHQVGSGGGSDGGSGGGSDGGSGGDDTVDAESNMYDKGTHHVMSDHVLLAAAVLGGLACESVIIVYSFAWKYRSKRISSLLLKALPMLVTVVSGLVSFEIYFTARHFHAPWETITAALIGLVLFQVPILYYATVCVCGSDASPKYKTS